MKMIQLNKKTLVQNLIWQGIEWFAINLLWSITQDFYLVICMKLWMTVGIDGLFHEDIMCEPKRLLWYTLSSLGYLISFCLQMSGFQLEAYLLSGFVFLAGLKLYNIGSFNTKVV